MERRCSIGTRYFYQKNNLHGQESKTIGGRISETRIVLERQPLAPHFSRSKKQKEQPGIEEQRPPGSPNFQETQIEFLDFIFCNTV